MQKEVQVYTNWINIPFFWKEMNQTLKKEETDLNRDSLVTAQQKLAGARTYP